MTEGIIFDIKKFALHDGPGIRTTVFLKGCPLRCAWCHNPESQSPKRELIVRPQRCIRCGACVVLCEPGALSVGKIGPRVNLRLCSACGACQDACNAEALQVVGKAVTVVEVLAEVLKDEAFYRQSKGGVTFSGGEPLAQPNYLLELLKESKRAGLHTTVDTCGYTPWKNIEKILPFADLFLYDIKLMNDKLHKKHTGASNKLILTNLEKLAESGARIIVRFAVIPGINDGDKSVRQIADFVAKLKRVERIDILPYHAMAADKYLHLQRIQEMAKVKPPREESVARIKKIFEGRGLKVKVGG